MEIFVPHLWRGHCAPTDPSEKSPANPDSSIEPPPRRRRWPTDEVKNIGEEKKKLSKWRMPQEQIDLILSWSPEPVRPPRYDVNIDGLQISDALKERLRRVEAEDAEAKREMDRYQKEQQEWVKAELAAHGYVECEIDDDDNPCICGCAYAGHEEEEGEGSEYDDDCECNDDDGEDEQEPTEETKEI